MDPVDALIDPRAEALKQAIGKHFAMIDEMVRKELVAAFRGHREMRDIKVPQFWDEDKILWVRLSGLQVDRIYL